MSASRIFTSYLPSCLHYPKEKATISKEKSWNFSNNNSDLNEVTLKL
jgi:hypothetical protein